ncbi:hypothetical protein ACO0SA_001952 [Hanseniaspora valbyensis]
MSSVKDQNNNTKKRWVAKRACLSCRTKKIKCDGEITVFQEGQERCSNCKDSRIEKCEFVPSKRGGRRPRKQLSPEEELKREQTLKIKREQRLRKSMQESKKQIKQKNKQKRKLSDSEETIKNSNSIINKDIENDDHKIIQKRKQSNGLAFNIEEASQKLEFPAYVPLKTGNSMQFLPVNDPLDKFTSPNTNKPFTSETENINNNNNSNNKIHNGKTSNLHSINGIQEGFPYNFFESKPDSPDASILQTNDNPIVNPFNTLNRMEHERIPSLNIPTIHSRHNSLYQVNPLLLKGTNIVPTVAQHSRKPSYFSNLLVNNQPFSTQQQQQQQQSSFKNKETEHPDTIKESPKDNNHTHSKSLSRILNDIFPKPLGTSEEMNGKIMLQRSNPTSDAERQLYLYGFVPPVQPPAMEFFAQQQQQSQLQQQNAFSTPQIIPNKDKDISIDINSKDKISINDSSGNMDKSSKLSDASIQENQQHTRNSSGYWSVPFPTNASPQPYPYQYSGSMYLPMNQNQYTNANVMHPLPITGAAYPPYQKPQEIMMKNDLKFDSKVVPDETTIANLNFFKNQQYQLHPSSLNYQTQQQQQQINSMPVYIPTNNQEDINNTDSKMKEKKQNN